MFIYLHIYKKFAYIWSRRSVHFNYNFSEPTNHVKNEQGLVLSSGKEFIRFSFIYYGQFYWIIYFAELSREWQTKVKLLRSLKDKGTPVCLVYLLRTQWPSNLSTRLESLNTCDVIIRLAICLFRISGKLLMWCTYNKIEPRFIAIQNLSLCLVKGGCTFLETFQSKQQDKYF